MKKIIVFLVVFSFVLVGFCINPFEQISEDNYKLVKEINNPPTVGPAQFVLKGKAPGYIKARVFLFTPEQTITGGIVVKWQLIELSKDEEILDAIDIVNVNLDYIFNLLNPIAEVIWQIYANLFPDGNKRRK